MTWNVDGVDVQVDSVTAAGPTDVTLTQTYAVGAHTVTVTVDDGIADLVNCETTVDVVLPEAFTFALFGNTGKMNIKEDTIISGDGFNNGDVTIGTGSRIIEGDLFLTGNPKGEDGSFTLLKSDLSLRENL